MQDMKRQFLDYLRQVYGADSMVTQQSLPPIEAGPNYPAFSSVNQGLSMMAQQPPMMGMGMGMGQPTARPMVGGPRPSGEMQSAQNILLGG